VRCAACRYYFYAQTADTGALLFTEMLVQTATGAAQFLIKVEDPNTLPEYLELWQMCLGGFYR
jgi:hypothetical protein